MVKIIGALLCIVFLSSTAAQAQSYVRRLTGSFYFPEKTEAEPPCEDIIMCMARSLPTKRNPDVERQIKAIEDMVNWKPLPPPNKPLPYASRLTGKVHIGRRSAGRKPMCAKAVREMLMAARLLPEPFPNPLYAKNYVPYLKKNGYVDDRRYCQTPGVIRVYGASRKKSKRTRRFDDDAGHVEFLGTDRRYHSFYSDRRPRNEVAGNSNRPLIGCMVKGSA